MTERLVNGGGPITHYGASIRSLGITNPDDEEFEYIFEDEGAATNAYQQTASEPPLRNLLPEEYRNFNVQRLFPDFRHNEVLRFGRVFNPAVASPRDLPNIWRGFRNSRARLEALAEREAAEKNGEEEDTAAVVDEQQPSTSHAADMPDLEETKDEVVEDVEPTQEEEEHQFELAIAPTPPPSEWEVDDEDILLGKTTAVHPCWKPEVYRTFDSSDSHGAGSRSSDVVLRAAPWRHGPAKPWFDMLGVPEDAQTLDWAAYIPKKKEKNREEEEEPMDGVETAGATTSGLSAAEVEAEEEYASGRERLSDPYHPNAFLKFNLVNWEDDIIYDPEEARERVFRDLAKGIQPACGWIATPYTNTYEQFMYYLKKGEFARIMKEGSAYKPIPFPPEVLAPPPTDPTKQSILPDLSNDFNDTNWEDDIIWDPDDVANLPQPYVLTYDLRDPNVILTLPEDRAPPGGDDQATTSGADADDAGKAGKDVRSPRKSQIVSGRVLNRNERKNEGQEEDLADENLTADKEQKDPFNLSNDEYYMPRGSGPSTMRSSTIQHSLPAQNLLTVWFPAHMKPHALRHFHRPHFRLHRRPLVHSINHAALMKLYETKYSVEAVESVIEAKHQERDAERVALGGGDLFFMRTPEDLSARDGELVLMEFSEEHPPLLAQPGMASRIRNYNKRKPGTSTDAEQRFEYGETSYTHTLPLLGQLHPGTSLQVLDNNLFRAPVYQHRLQRNTYLVIKNDTGFYIRKVNTAFTVGQECPLFEVQSPNSKRTTLFLKDFLMVYIYRQFWSSAESPPRVRMEDLRRAFGDIAESSIRKRLKQCAEFKRLGAGVDSGVWILREDFRLPSQEELRAILIPEACCAHYSMLAAEQRLKDAGYEGEKYIFQVEEKDENKEEAGNEPLKLEDEIKCAPWNTTRAFLMAVKEKCVLDLTGVADPTGCGEGFSYVRVSSKVPRAEKEKKEDKEEPETTPKKTVTGTDADLRKLSLKNAKELLRNFGVSDDDMKQLTRWEIIDVIRTLSTNEARHGGGNANVSKFARGHMRYSYAEIRQKFKQECQRLFDLQNRLLASEEPLTTDEESDEEEEVKDTFDLDEMSKKIDSMLNDPKRSATGGGGLTSAVTGQMMPKAVDGAAAAQKQPSGMDEAEERERIELKNLIHGTSSQPASVKPPTPGDEAEKKLTVGDGQPVGTRHLIISRVYRDQGQDKTLDEVVTRPEVIEAYMRVRNTKDETFIRNFVQASAEYREEKRKEKRRIQDRLRRLKRSEQRMRKRPLQQGRPPSSAPGLRSPSGAMLSPTQMSQQSSAAPRFGLSSQQKMNRFIGPRPKPLPRKVYPRKPKPLPEKPLHKMKCSACGAIGHMKTNRNCPYYDQRRLARLAAKVVPTDAELERQLSAVPADPAEALVKVEGTKLKISSRLMDHVRNVKQRGLKLKLNKSYIARQAKAADEEIQRRRSSELTSPDASPTKAANLSQSFSSTGSGSSVLNSPPVKHSLKVRIPKSAVVAAAQRKVKESLNRGRKVNVFQQQQKRLRLSQSYGPDYMKRPGQSVERRRTDPKVAMQIIFEKILTQLRSLSYAEPFLMPVLKRDAKDYYDVIKNPMDLQLIKKRISQAAYITRESFLIDLKFILENSVLYNGPDHPVTGSARRLLETAARLIQERENKLMRLEKQINPLLDSDERAFAHILHGIVERLRAVPKSFAFHQPVDVRKFPTYPAKITRPMDLSTIDKRIALHGYDKVNDFVADVRQILQNCETFNGAGSEYTAKARELVEVAREAILEQTEQLESLEQTIKEAKARSLDDIHMDVSVCSSSMIGDEEISPTQRNLPSRSTNDNNDNVFTLPAGEAGANADDERSMDMLAKATFDVFAGDEDAPPPTDFSGLQEAAEAEDRTETPLNPLELGGQLHADLAMSDSEDEDATDRSKAERVRVIMNDDDYDFGRM